MLAYHTLTRCVLTCSTVLKYSKSVILYMPQVTVSVRMKMCLNKIRDDEGHTSIDSVIRTLLVGNCYTINGEKHD